MSGPAGAPPFRDLPEAYQELLESLWYASEVFENEGDGGLEGAKLACHAVTRFIGVRHENPKLAAPFLEIRQSFEDLEGGLDPPLFSQNPDLRERERSSRRKHLQMLAAAAMEVLMALGTGSKDAATQVAEAVEKWPALRAQEITSTTVRNWRDQIRRKEDPRNRQFLALCEHLLEKPDPRSAIRALLQHPPGVPAS
jgi:hypothetical protein